MPELGNPSEFNDAALATSGSCQILKSRVREDRSLQYSLIPWHFGAPWLWISRLRVQCSTLCQDGSRFRCCNSSQGSRWPSSRTWGIVDTSLEVDTCHSGGKRRSRRHGGGRRQFSVIVGRSVDQHSFSEHGEMSRHFLWFCRYMRAFLLFSIQQLEPTSFGLYADAKMKTQIARDDKCTIDKSKKET